MVLEVPVASGGEVVEHGDAFDPLVSEQSIDEVTTDESPPAHDAVAPRTRPGLKRTGHPSASHFVALAARSGWLTRRCHTTAHNPSVCGVTLSGYVGGSTTHAFATVAVNPPSRPTMPKIEAPRPTASSRAP